jgi:hypothetical protein
VGLKDRLRALEREADENLVVVELEDGTTARFRDEEIYPECFLHAFDRTKRHHDGEDPGPAHPFIAALRRAADPEAIASAHGTFILNLLGEDEIMRGVRDRPGPPVRETSPGVYE